MDSLKKIVSVLTVFLVLFVFASAGAKQSVRVGFLVTSDLQSHVLPFETSLRADKNKTVLIGGLGRIATLAGGLRKDTDATLVFSTGDDLMVPFFDMFEGIPEIKAMNMACYDAVTPGNHEFDLGVRTYASAAREARFDIISSNLIIHDNDLSKIIKPWVIKSVAGLKIGIFGLMTPDLPRLSNVGDSVEVKNLFATAREMVKALHSYEVDLIVCLTHMGTRLDMQLANNVPGIDIIVGGHTHDYLFKKITRTNGNEVLIVHAGAGGEKAGILKFIFDGKVKRPRWETVLLDKKIPSDQEIDAFLEPYAVAYKEKLAQPIGFSEVALDARKQTVRTRESNLGNLIVDSWIDWFRSKKTHVDCALMNAGGIRGDRIYPAGQVSLKTLLEILPFGNTVYKMKLSGEQLLRAMEISASTLVVPGDGCDASGRPHAGAFLQVGGIRITIDLSKKPFCATYDGREIRKVLSEGNRIRRAEIFRKGKWEPVKKDKMYVVLTNSWLAAGGDGYYVFEHASQKEDTTFRVVDILTLYLKKHPRIKPALEGRIKILFPALIK